MNRYWLFGGVVSVILHAVVLGLLMSFCGPDGSLAREPSPSVPPSVSPSEPEPPVSSPSGGDSPRSVLTPEPVRPPAAVASRPDPAPPSSGAVGEYRVKAGDNLSRIAKAYGTTLAELAELNGTTVAKLANLRVGQVIKVPASAE